MNDEQKARLATISRMVTQDGFGLYSIQNETVSWLLALVKELDEKLTLWRSWDNKPTPEDALIQEAFPTRSGSHEQYAEAMRLVGARHSKGALVALVNWLLLRRGRAEQQLAAVTAERDELEREVARLKQEASESLAARLFNDALLRERAEKAEAEVARLNALVESATIFRYGSFSAEYTGLSDCWSVYRHGAQLMGRRLQRDEAIALARKLDAKESK